MLVKDIMTAAPVCISDAATLKDAHLLMQNRGVRHLPVIGETDGQYKGVLTHKKMVSTLVNVLNKYGQGGLDRKERMTSVAELMDAGSDTISDDEPLSVVVDFFIENKLGCLPVLGSDRKVIGIVTSSDFVKLCKRLLQP
ncbi:HPP family protein [Shewanella khirikhana]|uniref:Inosine 5'-monophosphate dehydrogenase n=1 Tax=Shewanella khirikhana TaxID=1965282 RepID=A0ABM7DQB3_9GAMM|nr:CBS domain-containing protein [Shewanella khirikhana]AZQ11876.1 inosine 5'-monophosphate dehydrogenase [Shewanella khirikhana]